MKTIEIPRSILNHSNHFLHKSGQFDILGCILIFNGIDIPDKTRLPSELKQEIQYFTRSIRKRYVDTELTYKLLDLDCSPQKEAVQKANVLLKPIGIELRIIEK